MEVGNLPNKKFKVIIMKIIKQLGRRMNTVRSLTKLEDKKKNQKELKNTIPKIKNTLQGRLPWWRSGWESAC